MLPLLLKLTNSIHKLNNTGPSVYGRRLAKVNSLFDPVEMSQAAQYTPAGPAQPVKRPGKTRLFLVPAGIVLLLLAIPGGVYVFSQHELSQAPASGADGADGSLLSQVATV